MGAEEWWLTHWKFLSAPLLGAFIGWITNYVAVKMLFRPRRAINCGLFILHGVFPRRQKALAENLGKAIEKNLINHDDLRHALSAPQFQQFFRDAIAEKINGFLHKLVETNPMLALLLNNDLREKIGAMMLQEIGGAIPDLLTAAADKLQNQLSFSEIVREKIEKFDSAQIEQLLLAVMKKEFGFIEFVGGALGFLIGAIQAALFYWG